ncbi:MAG TPA: sulfatase, partial [Thermoanaerobaculia bacterium]|nr:sulfatase [Thermoanaerobaculia bacterium]
MAALQSRIFRAAAPVVWLCVLACRREAVAVAAPSPDIPVFIISIDTLRSDHLPAYGYVHGSTPAIDRFRKDALLFRKAFSNVPLTLPSHCSMMTGLLPYTHGVRDNLGYALPVERRTLATLLKEKGYETGAAVSSFVLRSDSGISRGFDTWDDLMTVSTLESISSWQRDGDVSRQVLERWLASTHSHKVFGFLHLYEPHKPYRPPQPFASKLQNPYDGEIAYADSIVGLFLDSLRSKGLYDGALIIILSDHGEGLGDHGESEHGVFLYRESIQIPLIVKLPRQARAGQEDSAVSSIVDILPTVLGRLGLSAPPGVEGIDLFSEAATRPADRMVYSETYYPRLHYGWHELMSLAGAEFHFIEAPRAELYDYVADREERRNLAQEQRRILASARTQIQAIAAAHPFESPKITDPEVVAKLSALGYLGSGPATLSGALPDPKDKLDLLELRGTGTGYLQSAQYEKAIEIGKKIVASNPDFLPGWGLMSSGYEKLGRRELALDALEEQMRRSPG